MRLFIDIETVPEWESFDDLTDQAQDIYMKKFSHEFEGIEVSEHYSNKAALFAEWGKIVCVSCGYESTAGVVLKSFCRDNEHQILTDLFGVIEKADALASHNGKNFDYPFLCRRMIINGVQLPRLLQIQNLKPWEIRLEDTMEMWKFGQFNASISLASLCNALGIQSPKGDMDGGDVSRVFYVEKDYGRIAKYCEGDVLALINCYRRMNYQPILSEV